MSERHPMKTQFYRRKSFNIQCIRLVFLSIAAISFFGILESQAQDAGDNIYKGYVPNPTINPYAGGTIYNQNGINNPYEGYGPSSSSDSFNNPSTTEVPRLFDEYGNYKGP